MTGHGNADLPGYESRTVSNIIKLSSERYLCAEALFDPGSYLGRDTLYDGVHGMVGESIKSLPIDLKREVYGNIILAGGTTLLPGFAARLTKELQKLLPAGVTLKVRQGSSWDKETVGIGEKDRGVHSNADNLRFALPSGIYLQVHDPVNRHLAVWTGGSVLASTQHFNGHWISRDEYQRYGAELIHATR